MTEVGKESSAALARTSSFDRLFWTMNWARSPTTFELGVTYRSEQLKAMSHHNYSCITQVGNRLDQEVYVCPLSCKELRPAHNNK